MRGKAGHIYTLRRFARITPAYAGKRCRSPAFRSMPWDHPRMCGEKKKAEEMGATTKGSPPRMRGKGVGAARIGCGVGITPACAGKSRCPLGHHPRLRDHPRMCGEKTAFTSESELSAGSPPRMRGKVGVAAHRGEVLGITPAYAGKSGVPCCNTRLWWDHPRVCGEKKRP